MTQAEREIVDLLIDVAHGEHELCMALVLRYATDGDTERWKEAVHRAHYAKRTLQDLRTLLVVSMAETVREGRQP